MFSRHRARLSGCRDVRAMPVLAGITGGKTIIFSDALGNIGRSSIPAKSALPTLPKTVDWSVGSISISLASLADPRFLPRPGDVLKSMNFIPPGLLTTQTRPADLANANTRAKPLFFSRIVAPLDAFGFHELILQPGASLVAPIATSNTIWQHGLRTNRYWIVCRRGWRIALAFLTIGARRSSIC